MLILLIISLHVLSVRAGDVVIQSFERNGEISFNEIPDAISYRVEWASAVNGNWTNFTGDVGLWMDDIPPSGLGVITASVPMVYRILAQIPPEGMVYIPAGSFMMGNSTNVFPEGDGGANELPQHDVYLDAYLIDKYEVTRDLWIGIKAPAHVFWGYSFSNDVSPSSSTRPMSGISWYDSVKWCNARSQIEGFTPVYYTDESLTNVYKAGELMPFPNWSANGYRLPTEAEWEKAARGGIADLRFPWSDYTNNISHSKANYYAGFQSYDLSNGDHPGYNGFSPVGSFGPNGYGLYDMAGNVWEWCWDWYDNDYYSTSPSNNPLGAMSGEDKVVRGGNTIEDANHARSAFRRGYPPGYFFIEAYDQNGFRCVRKP